MNFPPALDRLLKNGPLHGSVLLSFNEFEPWFRLSGTPFFPEFTDHGMGHVFDVLKSATSLIRDEAWPIFTSNDAAVLCIASLLHDSAMHLTEEGFMALIYGPPRPVSLPGEVPWPEMWVEFLSEASRFDGKKLVALFGEDEPIHRPGMDPAKWQKRDRLLIGEFVRRHHTSRLLKS